MQYNYIMQYNYATTVASIYIVNIEIWGKF